MSDNAYETGRLNLPFVGHTTFAKSPVVSNWNEIDADFAVLGVPYDMGCQYRSGARFGPRGIRASSTLFSFGHSGAYDYEGDTLYLQKEKVRIVDLGDVDMIHTNTEKCLENTEAAVRAILKSGATPVILGGDHAITAANVAAYSEEEPIHVVQFDAHLDFVDERHGVRYGHGNCMRRISEMEHVSGMTQLGIRNVSSSNQADHQAAKDAGSTILSVRQVRKLGLQALLEKIPAGKRYYLTIDIDGFDPSIAPGTGTPSHGGFAYYEVLEVIEQLAQRGDIVGVDVCEVAPPYDPTEVTSILAAQLLMNTIGYIAHHREQKALGAEA
ncbi:agmatinase [Marinobacterium lutimaris]|uniref:Agmatinase n=1 Tax=Marinobacterium lutimaris TaxID=568106 RepID=A0A1H6B6F8_9GAMM|nr:agmatinase [Marinobacterium lutimaris]SEG56200.1 agmatinase [Marinobacterium lutimaris]